MPAVQKSVSSFLLTWGAPFGHKVASRAAPSAKQESIPVSISAVPELAVGARAVGAQARAGLHRSTGGRGTMDAFMAERRRKMAAEGQDDMSQVDRTGRVDEDGNPFDAPSVPAGFGAEAKFGGAASKPLANRSR